jgi:hypothetical protein
MTLCRTDEGRCKICTILGTSPRSQKGRCSLVCVVHQAMIVHVLTWHGKPDIKVILHLLAHVGEQTAITPVFRLALDELMHSCVSDTYCCFILFNSILENMDVFGIEYCDVYAKHREGFFVATHFIRLEFPIGPIG